MISDQTNFVKPMRSHGVEWDSVSGIRSHSRGAMSARVVCHGV